MGSSGLWAVSGNATVTSEVDPLQDLLQVYGDDQGNFTAGAGLLVALMTFANFQGTGPSCILKDAQTSHIVLL